MRMLRLFFMCTACLAVCSISAQPQQDRLYWSKLCYDISAPLLSNMSKGELKKNMPVVYSPTWDGRASDVAYMEAFGRLMAGITPWLELPADKTAESAMRTQMREWALKSYANAVDPESPDCLLWNGPDQALVDAAYIASSFIRAPRIWEELDKVTKQRYVENFRSLRRVKAPYNNWLLFRATIEAFFVSIGESYDAFALNVALRKLNEWYLGDGWYSDGTEYSLDYYNSYVIHPMLVEVLEILKNKDLSAPISFDLALRRMQRYNSHIERLISPEGAYPAVGRSMTYRMAAFQSMALSAWKYGLPEGMTPGQVRSALTAVMRRMFSIEGNFDDKGFLQLGFVGSQPDLADYYSNTGSLYMTSLVFLPLGLPSDAPFWTDEAQPWTAKKAWGGQPFPKDYHQSLIK